ncbi:MAG: TolC family protein [Betaproteobacteria bacterium]|nr:TolC family protein [Betaproteobacteria bacterium]
MIRMCVCIIGIPMLMSGCGFQQYFAKPLEPQAISSKLKNKSIGNEAFIQYLVLNGYSRDQIPFKHWGVDELTYCALFFHPSLDVARAQWRAAVANQASASEKPIPSVSTRYARSNNVNQDVSPWLFEFGIDIPFETANKRDIRIENANHLSEVAKLEIAQRAWILRNMVAQALHAYQLNEKQLAAISNEYAIKKEIVDIFQKRLDLGAATIVDLSNAKLQLQSTTAEQNALLQKRFLLHADLASHIGLPLEVVKAMPLMQAEEFAPILADSRSETEEIALLNRLDIRIALERYATAEAKIKLEIANQYPNIVFSPAYIYEFGSRLWSLGFSGLLTVLNKNKLAIAEAQQLREVEAAQFEALQNTVIAEVNTAFANVIQTTLVAEEQKRLHTLQKNNTMRVKSRLSAGEADRLEMTYAKLEETLSEKNVTNADFELRRALIALENVRQVPLNKRPLHIDPLRFDDRNPHS